MSSLQERLVLPNDRETLLAKLDELKVEGLTQKERKRLRRIEIDFVDDLNHLCHRKCGIYLSELTAKLSDSELDELGRLIAERAVLRSWLQKLFVYGLPIVGWVIGYLDYSFSNSHHLFTSWGYRRGYKQLKRVYGANFSPALIIRK